MNKSIFLIALLFIAIFQYSCDNKNNDKDNNNDTINNLTQNSLEFKYIFDVKINEKAKCGDIATINFEITDTLKFDSVELFINDKKINGYKEKISYNIETKDFKVGKHDIYIKVYAYGIQKILNKQIFLLSDLIPVQKKYKIVNTYNHDVEAYTQGLILYNGFLYESTGLQNKSSLRKVNPKTGEVVFSTVMPNNIFGEGITIFNDKIYMITWRDHIAYCIDKDNFQVINEFNFSTEGWGLTNDEQFLYLSDGSDYIYKVDPSSFTFIDKIQVIDNIGTIQYINEMEYINGKIYANVYQEDYIVVIEPKTGKVLEKIDFTGILPQNLRTQNTDVLNGIAYNKSKNTIFITGKNWPKLFEVTIN